MFDPPRSGFSFGGAAPEGGPRLRPIGSVIRFPPRIRGQGSLGLTVQTNRAMHGWPWKLRRSSCGSSNPPTSATASTGGACAGLADGTSYPAGVSLLVAGGEQEDVHPFFAPVMKLLPLATSRCQIPGLSTFGPMRNILRIGLTRPLGGGSLRDDLRTDAQYIAHCPQRITRRRREG